MNIKMLGWVLLAGGGIGVSISSFIGASWPLFACAFIAVAGAVVVLASKSRINF